MIHGRRVGSGPTQKGFGAEFRELVGVDECNERGNNGADEGTILSEGPPGHVQQPGVTPTRRTPIDGDRSEVTDVRRQKTRCGVAA